MAPSGVIGLFEFELVPAAIQRLRALSFQRPRERSPRRTSDDSFLESSSKPPCASVSSQRVVVLKAVLGSVDNLEKSGVELRQIVVRPHE